LFNNIQTRIWAATESGGVVGQP